MNLKSLLNKSVLELKRSGIDTPELDTKVLLVAAMAKQDAFVYSHPDFLVTNAQYAKFRRFIRRRKCGEPIAYILGHKEFYGYSFRVNKNVLVPRPESEWLVEKSLEYIKKLSDNSYQISVLDVGTGSGCIILSLAKECEKQFNHQPAGRQGSTIQQFNFYAVDSSKRAIAVAKNNLRLLKPVHSTLFLNSNLFSSARLKNKKFNIIVANLPYVPPQLKKVKSSIDFEPQDAIFARNNGTEIIKKFLSESTNHIEKECLMLLELDPRNANDLLNFTKKIYPVAEINLRKDLAGLDRYLEIRTK